MPLLSFLLPSIFLVFLAQAKNQRNVRLLVQLDTGTVEGTLITSESGASGYGFMGIPYAQPPVGWLRFRTPIPVRPWDGVLPCKEYRATCWQVHTTVAGEDFRGVEDCLYLNVFVGQNCSERNPCPVLYYIHGGAWDFDTPSAFPPELLVHNFASHGLIMITVNYRLNVFGFWSSGGEEAVGNYGMQDLVAGLHWVQREVHHFGGDPAKVTIMGHSSGAVAVTLLTLSPKTEGLFHQAVMMSGNGVDDSVLSNDLSLHRRVASALGCANDTSHPWQDWANVRRRREVVECMRRVDADILGNTYKRVQGVVDGRTSPRVDGPDGLFPMPVSKLVKNRRPLTALTGTTKREFGIGLRAFVNATSKTVESVCSASVSSLGVPNEKAIITECKRHYVTPYLDIVHTQTANGTVNFWAEQCERITETLAFHSACYKDASTLRRKGARVFLYSFDYSKTGQEDITPSHAFDLPFVVGAHAFPYDQRDKDIQRIYASLFANFAKYGDPTPNVPEASGYEKWTPLEWPVGFNYFSIDLPTPRLKPDYHKDDIIFWNYVIPYKAAGRRADSHEVDRTLLNSLQVDAHRHEQHKAVSDSSTSWHSGVAVVLTVLVVASLITLARVTAARRVQPGGMERTERRKLISDHGDKQELYQTFS